MRRVMMVVACAAALAGCRDGIAPWEVPETVVDPDAPLRQITFGTGQDLDPVWMPGGDALLYHTTQYSMLPGARGALLRIDGTGGVALPVLEDVQRSSSLLATPAVSPDGSRIAYFHIISVDPVSTCTAVEPPLSIVCPISQPVLDSAALRVRRIDATTPAATDPALGVKFDGTDPRLRFSGGALYTMQALPFQQAYRDERSILMRPSWAPDNQRIVFSDGLRLRIWRAGDPAATTVPGTDDGVSAAWSPDGARIAFTRLERIDSTTYSCFCSRSGVGETHVRTVYTTRATVMTIRPDGTDPIVVGPGGDPAWSPDGQSLYLRRENRIVRVTLATGATVQVANADYGRAPAVSPDGRQLAFSRSKTITNLDWDIWVVSLSP